MPLTNRAMQVSTVERYHLMPVQTAVSKKIGQQQTVRMQRGAALRDSILQPLWKAVLGLFTRLELELLYHPAVSLREIKSVYWKESCLHILILTFLTITKMGKQITVD